MEKAALVIEANLEERARVFDALVKVWEKTRLPKGLSMPGKPFFHQQDRARHFAFRRADMTYLIYDEQRLGLEDYSEESARVYALVSTVVPGERVKPRAGRLSRWPRLYPEAEEARRS